MPKRRRDENEEAECSPLADGALEAKILELIRKRGLTKTCGPSEAPRALTSAWRPLMPETRRIAVQLACEGVLEITQKGQVIEPSSSFTGPIRLRLKEQ